MLLAHGEFGIGEFDIGEVDIGKIVFGELWGRIVEQNFEAKFKPYFKKVGKWPQSLHKKIM